MNSLRTGLVFAALFSAACDAPPPVPISAADAAGERDAGTVAVDAGPAPDGGALDATPDVAPKPEVALAAVFIGNSYTYVNDLPAMMNVVGQQMPPFQTESLTIGSASFSTHWATPATRERLMNAKDTFVVLQGQSLEALSPQSFEASGKPLVAGVQSGGGIPVLFETWARSPRVPGSYPGLAANFDAMQDRIYASYSKLAKDTGAVLAPVGEAWRKVVNEHPEIELYAADGSHPSVFGTYLTACVFYKVMAKRPLPGVAPILAPDWPVISPEAAKLLRDSAAATTP